MLMDKWLKVIMVNPRKVTGDDGSEAFTADVDFDGSDMSPAEATGLLLLGYSKMAQAFLGTHPADCKDCEAFKLHQNNLLALLEVQKETTSRLGFPDPLEKKL